MTWVALDPLGSAWLPLLAAPFAGSLLGVMIRRLPRGESWMLARSRCESCGRALGPLELLPLLGYAALRGRCRGCGQPIPPFHPAVELAALAVAAWAFTVDAGAPGLLWADCVLGWTLLALAWIDWDWLRLPDPLTLPLLLAGLAATALWQPGALGDHALGATLGYLGLRALAFTYRRLRGRDGIGEGDAKLLAAAGAWVGSAALPQVLLLAALAGLLLAAVRRVAGGQRLHALAAVPFGPPLALALWLVWLYGGIAA